MNRSQPVPIVIPHVDVSAVLAENAHLKAMVAELRDTVAELRQQIESQQAHIHRLVKLTFGRGGERVLGPTLFDAMTPPEPVTPLVDAKPVEEPATSKRKGHGRKKLPHDLPRQREVLDLGDAETRCGCGAAKLRIGESVSERLDYRPMSLFVREIVRPVYACRCCEANGDAKIAKAELPPEPLPKSGLGAGLLAHVIVSKFVDHLPLHRQEQILARHGWPVRRSRLCDLLRRCGLLLTPLYEAMKSRVKQSFAIHADDTPVTLLRPHRTAYAWVYLGDDAHPFTLFDFTPGRREEFPQNFLNGYQGFVHADAYSGYNAVHNHARHLGCWMHARRKFVEAQENDPRSVEALAFIRTLYAVEGHLREPKQKHGKLVTDADVVKTRQTRAGPILEEFSDWLETQHRSATPKSLFGQAVEYARNQWSSLVRYLTDARFAIDNGVAERAIRPLAISRNNWLHIGGDRGLATAGVLMSLAVSATRHRLNPWAYLTDVLNQLAHRDTDIAALLPDAWARKHAPAA